MFGNKTETPYADWPKTKPLDDEGFHVTGQYLHPSTPRTSDALGITIGVIAFLIFLGGVGDAGGFFAAAFFAFIIAAISSPVLRSMMYKNLDIKVLPDRIMVGGRWGYKTYMRDVPLEFRVERHRKAEQEALAEQRSRERQAVVYRQAIEVVMQYGERRIVLAEMREKDIDNGHALAFRLQNICESQNEAMRQIAESQYSPIEPVLRPRGTGDFGPGPEIR